MDKDALSALVDKHAERIKEAARNELEAIVAGSAVRAASQSNAPPRADDREGRRPMHDKVFEKRESLLTVMLQGKDESYLSIYHAMLATLVWLGLRVVLQDFKERSIFIDPTLFVWSFNRLDVVMGTWVVMFCMSLSVIPFVLILKSHPNSLRVFSRLAWVYAALVVFLFTFATFSALSNRLSPASGFIVMCESARFAMKMHAYLREKVVLGLPRYWAELQQQQLRPPASEKTTVAAAGKAGVAAAAVVPATLQDRLLAFADHIPAAAAKAGVTVEQVRASRPTITIGSVNDEINMYMYFLFCPTLVYRDEYPRTGGSIDWVKALTHLLNLIGVMVYTYVIIRGILTPLLGPLPPTNVVDVVLLIQATMLPAMLVFFLAFFGILHSWFNLWAELLRFADRRFYGSWWTCSSWSSYYRRWNMVVGDFLYYYLLNDIQRAGYSHKIAELTVFAVSAFIHELIIAAAFRFWYPALLLMFGGPGIYFTRLTRKFAPRLANVFLWLMLSVGLGILTLMYTRELHARYGYEWEGSTIAFDPNLHPMPGWGAADWIRYILVPRSWVQFGQLWGDASALQAKVEAAMAAASAT